MSRRTKKANPQQQEQPIRFLELSYPITAQAFAKIKKELKSCSDRGQATHYLDSLLAALDAQIGSKQQIIYIQQLALACIISMGDANQCNKAVTRFLSFTLFKESYFLSVTQHRILHGKDSISSAKLPNVDQIKVLMTVDKRCRENPSAVCIYLVNLLRILIGLRLHSSSFRICDALECPGGLLFWTNRLNVVDKSVFSSLSDHIFRVLYGIIFTPSTESEHATQQDASCLSHCLYFYKNSSKFQVSALDKLLAQCFKYLKSNLGLQNFDIVKFFEGNVFATQNDPKYRQTMLLWLDPMLNLNLEVGNLAVILDFFHVALGQNAICFAGIMGLLKLACQGQLNKIGKFSSTQSLSCVDLQPLYCCLISALNKKIFRIIDPIFQDRLTGKASVKSIHGCLPESLSTIYREIISDISSFDNELFSTTLDSSVIILCEMMFIQNHQDYAFYSLWSEMSPLSDGLAYRLASLSYNIGASLGSVNENVRALGFFEASLRFYHLVSSKNSDCRKELKSWQGKCQCLYQLSRYEDCQSGVVESMRLFLLGDYEIRGQKLVDTLVTLYASSGLHLASYIPLCLKLCTNRTDLIDVELEAVAVFSDSQFSQACILDYALSLPDVALTSMCQYLLHRSELDASLCESYCTQVQSVLSSQTMTQERPETLLCYFFLSKSHIVMGVSLKELSIEDWISTVFLIWTDALHSLSAWEHIPAAAQDLLDKFYGSASQLFDFCFGHSKLKYALQVHSFCIRFCELRTDKHMPTDLVEQFVKAASAYIDMGHSGNAGDSLSSAKQLLSRADENSKFGFYYCYADYLLTIGNYRKAREIRDRLTEDPFHSGGLDILGAKIDLSTGCFHTAQEKSTAGYRSLMKKLKHSSSISPHLVSKCYKALLLLCGILFLQGFPLQLQYYFDQGMTLATKMGSNVFSAIISIEFARFLKMKRSLTLSADHIDLTTKKFGKELQEFSFFSASLLQCRGEIFSSMGNADAAEESYISAASVIDSELDNPADELEEAFRKGLAINSRASASMKDAAPSSALNLRSVALEIFKGRLSCLLGSVLFRNGKLKQSEDNFNLAKSLPLTSQERCIYHNELAKVRASQFFENYSKVDQGVFEESVTSLQSDWTRKVTRSDSTLKRVDQLELLLKEAFSLVCKYGIPDDAQQLAFSLCKLSMFRANVLGNFEGISVFDNVYQALEHPKCLFGLRQNRRIGTTACEADYNASTMKTDIDTTLEYADCIIVCVNVDISSESLYVSRLSSTSSGDASSKTLFKLPIRRFAIRDGCVDGPGLSFQDAMAQFSEIMIGNKETTTGAKFCTTPAQKKQWLQRRIKLNSELKEFLAKLENEWLAGFKGLFSNRSFSRCQPQLKKFQCKLEKLIAVSVKRCLKSKGKTTSVVDRGFCEMILRGLGPTPQYEDLEDVLYFILDNYQLQGIAVEYDEISIEDMRDDLKALVELFFKESTCKSLTGPSCDSNNEQPIVLILDKNVQHLPWESLPILRDRQVSRLPNIAMLYQCISGRSRKVQIGSPDSAFYLLNPSGDLIKTEKKLSEPLSRWNGIRGRAPLQDEFRTRFENANLFLYFGHGGGEIYIDSNDIRKLCKVPVILLFGCSSGYLKNYGEFDCLGIAREYLDAGSPSVLGNLWDVTDIDIDKFALSLMEKTGLSALPSSSQDLVSAANLSREACSLEYIVGAAPVVYGLPISFFT